MDLWEAIKERRSIRRYVQGRDVPTETVEQLLQVVGQAPVVIVVCADPTRSASRYSGRGSELYCLQDTAAATENILLGVTALGLGACWVGAFDERAATTVLDLPSHLRPVVMIPIGHPSERSVRRTPRRPLSEITTFIG